MQLNSTIFCYMTLSQMFAWFLGTSFHSDKLVKWKEIIPNDDPIVVVVGAMAHGSVSLICGFFSVMHNHGTIYGTKWPFSRSWYPPFKLYLWHKSTLSFFSDSKIKHEQHTLVTVLKFAQSYCLKFNFHILSALSFSGSYL